MFDFFKKKKEKDMLDLRQGKEEIPVPDDVRQKLQAQTAEQPTTTEVAVQPETTTTNTSSFANFFGAPSSPTPNATSTESTSTTKVRVRDILDKISKLTDRVELLERKIQRLEGK